MKRIRQVLADRQLSFEEANDTIRQKSVTQIFRETDELEAVLEEEGYQQFEEIPNHKPQAKSTERTKQ